MSCRSAVRSWWLCTFALLLTVTPREGFAQSGDVLEARGEASYTIPILIPPGPAGHQPRVELVYNSGEGKGAAGWLGFGWSLGGESRIERDTHAGTPYDLDNPTCTSTLAPTDGAKFACYRSAFSLDGQPLVCDSGTCSTCSAGSPCRYRTKSDDGRIIKFLGATAGWTINDRDGRVHVYGASAAGRLVNPIINQVFSWQLESSTDVNNNAITYQYDTTSSANVAYLKKILYGVAGALNRSVEFILQTRTDKPISFRSGMRQQTDRRVATINVKDAASALVTRYELTYGQDPDNTRSQLVGVVRKGSDGISALPPYLFQYSQRPSTQGMSPTAVTSFNSSPTSCSARGGLFSESTYGYGIYQAIADMNRDGIGDIYARRIPPQSETTRVAIGSGTRFIPGPGEDCSYPASGEKGTTWFPFPRSFASTSGLTAVLDANGDGYLDVLSQDADYSFPNDLGGLNLGGPAGFASTATPFSILAPGAQFDLLLNTVQLGVPRYFQLDHGDSTVSTQMIDVTGDGLPDEVAAPCRDYSFNGCPGTGPFYTWDYWPPSGPADTTWQTWTGWAVFVNHGLKTGPSGPYLEFASAPVRWPAPVMQPIQFTTQGGVTGQQLADENGDGLLDRVHGGVVEYGTGAGFWPTETHALSNAYLSWTVNGCTYYGPFDLNGDGFLDSINASSASTANPVWTVAFGTGSGYAPGVSFPIPGDLNQPGTATQCVEGDGATTFSHSLKDVSGDGVPDRLGYGVGVNYNLGALDPAAATDPSLPSAALPGLLLRATDPLGGIVEFTYKAVPEYKDANGNSASPGFGFARPTVSRVVHRDGRTGANAAPAITTTYQYAGAVFDYAQKEFRGFTTVTATLLEAGQTPTTVVTTRATDSVCAFNTVADQVSSGSSVISRSSRSYVTVTGSGAVPWGRCLLSVATEEAVEGNEAGKKVRRTSYDYGSPINANYNVAAITEWGQWNPASNADIPGDERVTTYTYTATGTTPGIVSRVREVAIKDTAGTIFERTQYCYKTGCPDDADKGLLQSVIRYLSDPVAVPPISNVPKTVATILYDGYGNMIQTTGASTSDDPNGLQSLIGYDATYHTFPISITKGSDTSFGLTTTLSYTGCTTGAPPPALGLPCSVTEPGSQTSNFQYDVFGRTTRIETPSSGYVETRAYSLPPVAGAGQTITETHRMSLVYKSFTDGLGREYRNESPGKLSETVAVTRTFDDRGRVASESLPFVTGTGLSRVFSYDAIGRVDGIGEPSGSAPEGATSHLFTYQPWLVIDQAYFGTTIQSYTHSAVDGLGRVVRVGQYLDPATLGWNYLVNATYDPADRLLQVRDPISTNPPIYCTGLPAPCQTQRHTTDLVWDTMGRRVKIDDPDSGIWTFTYNDAGLLKSRKQNPGASQRALTYTYDELQRLKTKAVSPSGMGTAALTLFYYQNSGSASDFGQLRDANSPITSYHFGYDAAGRKNSTTQRTAGKAFTTNWTYDELGRVTRQVFPDSEAFNYAYDGTRLATILADPANGAFKGTVLKQAQFDPLGRIKTLDLGQNGSAPVATVDYSYDAANARLTRVRGMIGATTPVDLNVVFDGLGRLTSQSGSLGAETVSRSYTYDGLSRLSTATGPWEKPLGINTPVTWTYAYDPLGNLRTQTSSRGASGDNRTWTYADAVRPRYLTSFAQQGQLTQNLPPNAFGEPSMVDRGSGNQEPFTWNGLGKLYQYKSSTYSWDAFDQNTLVVTGSPATSIVRVGDDFEFDLSAGRATKYFSVDGVRIAVLATTYTPPAASLPPALYPVVRNLELIETLALATLFLIGFGSLGAIAANRHRPEWVGVPGVGMLALMLVAMPYSAYAATLPPGGPGTYGRPAEAFLAYLTDHLGSVRAVVNSSGTIVETRDYDPFGGDISHSGTFSVQHRFTGQPADDQAGGLYNYSARFYNAKWGRFISPDELVQGFDSQGLNPYSYVLNRPTSAIDPHGRDLDFGSGAVPSIPSLSGTFSGGSWASGGLGVLSGIGAGHGDPCKYDACYPPHPLKDQPSTAKLGGGTELLAGALILGAPVDWEILALWALGAGLIYGASQVMQSKIAVLTPGKNIEAGDEVSHEEAVEEVEGGGSTISDDETTARDVAKDAGEGDPIYHAPHESGGPRARPHYHPSDAHGEIQPGHSFW